MKTALLIAGPFVGGLVLGWLLNDGSSPVEPAGKRGATSKAFASDVAPGLRSDPSGLAPQVIQFTAGQSSNEVLMMTRGVLRDTNPRRRLRNFVMLLDGLTNENAAVILSAFTSWPEDGPALPADCQSIFFQSWGELAREDAYRSVQSIAPGSDAWIGDIVNGWAQVDRVGLERFISSLPEASRERDLAALTFARMLATVDLQEAGAFALKEVANESKNSRRLFEELVDQATREDRTDLLAEWFEHAPGGSLKSTLATNTVEALRTKSIEDAVTFLSNVGDAKWRDWDMYWRTAGDYATRDPKAALEWIFTLPRFPGESAPPGLASVVQKWHTNDPAAATAWLQQNGEQAWWPRAARGVLDSMKQGGNSVDSEAFLASLTPEAQKLIRESAKNPKPVPDASR